MLAVGKKILIVVTLVAIFVLISYVCDVNAVRSATSVFKIIQS